METTAAFTKERYDEIKRQAESMGIIILTKYRKGLKNIRVGDIVLDDNYTKTPVSKNVSDERIML